MHGLQSVGLAIAGSLILLIGVGHIFMPIFGYRPEASQGMTPEARDHFYFLGTYAISAFLIGYGTLTLALVREVGSRFARIFSLVMAAVWGVRVVLELAYPVTLPIYFLEYPHPILLGVIGSIFAAFSLAAIAALRRMRA